MTRPPAMAADAVGAGRADTGAGALTIHEGEIVAVVGASTEGPGGALRRWAGLPGRGGGQDGVRLLVGDPPVEAAPPALGYVRAGVVGPGELTVLEWLAHVAAHRGGSAATRRVRVQTALALVGLGGLGGGRIGALDRDASEQLAVATLAISGARLLLFDDCFGGVRLATRRLLHGALTDLGFQGRTVVLAPRDVLAVEGLATRVVVLRHGRVLADLRMADVQRARVAEILLNGGALAAVPRIVARFPDAVRTGTGMAVPLTAGRSLEYVLAVLREERIAVAGSRVRYRAVEEFLDGAPPDPDPVRAAALG